MAAEAIQNSTSKALGFIGRAGLHACIHNHPIIHYDLDNRKNFNTNFLRLICHILDKGSIPTELFRIAVGDSEQWDYAAT